MAAESSSVQANLFMPVELQRSRGVMAAESTPATRLERVQKSFNGAAA